MELWSRQATRFSILIVLFSLFTLSTFAELRPTIALVTDASALAGGASTSQVFLELTAGDVEGRLLDDNRFLVRKRSDSDDPEDVVGRLSTDGAVFVRAASRRDGSARVEVDVWVRDADRFVLSREYPITTGIDRFADAARIAGEAVDILNEQFPLPAILEFENRGSDDSYAVYLDDEYIGGNIRRLALSEGQYHLSVRRREFDREIIVGERDLNLEPDDYYRVVFELEPIGDGPVAAVPDPGAIPRWRSRLTIHGSAYFPDQDSTDPEYPGEPLAFEHGASTYLSLSWNDALFRSNFWGLEMGAVYLGVDEPEIDDNLILRLDAGYIPLIAFTGIELGVPGIADVAIRTGAGLALSIANDDFSATGGARSMAIPAFNEWGAGIATRTLLEFGIHVVPGWRLSFGANVDGLFEVQSTEYFTRFGVSIGTGFQF